MQVQKRSYKTYKYVELSEEAKQKALWAMYDLNIDYDWWTMELEALRESVKSDLGIDFEPEHACFDLDRGSYFYVDAKHDGNAHVARIWIEDLKTFCKTLSREKISRRVCNRILDGRVSIGIDMKHYGGGDGRNIIEVEDMKSVLTDDEYKALDDACTKILEGFTADALSMLRKEMEYLTSPEAIVDTIEANDYDFLESGKMFTL